MKVRREGAKEGKTREGGEREGGGRERPEGSK